MLGNHILVEFYGCGYDALNSSDMLNREMVKAADMAGATVIESKFHKFSPFGVSGVVVLAESHLTIHTWPEHGYAAVDLFTCGGTVDPWAAFDHLKEVLGSTSSSTVEMKRGRMADIEASSREVCA